VVTLTRHTYWRHSDALRSGEPGIHNPPDLALWIATPSCARDQMTIYILLNENIYMNISIYIYLASGAIIFRYSFG